MLTLNNSIQKTMANVNQYIESWKQRSSLWKVDKNGVLDKFAAKNPTNAQFEEKLAKYHKMAEEMWAQASATQLPEGLQAFLDAQTFIAGSVPLSYLLMGMYTYAICMQPNAT